MTLIVELPDEQQAALAAKAHAHGVSVKQYAQQVLQNDLQADRAETGRPLSDVIGEIWTDMPPDVRAKLPRDGASEVDHYVYGLPKRAQ